MEYTRDAGRCCGLYIAFGFGDRPTAETEATLKRLMSEREADVRNRNPGRLVARPARGWFPGRAARIANVCTQVTLTDAQMASGWDRILKDMGFRLVTRFDNSNSNNHVNILHHSATRASRRPAELPFRW